MSRQAANAQKRPNKHPVTTFSLHTHTHKRNATATRVCLSRRRRRRFSQGVSLLAAVVGGHHQVAVGTQLSDAGRLAAAVDRRRLAFHPRELQHAAGVVLEQVALEGLPASADAHHHVLVVQHLLGGDGIRVLLVTCRSRAEPS